MCDRVEEGGAEVSSSQNEQMTYFQLGQIECVVKQRDFSP